QQTRGSDALPINSAAPARRTETDEAQRAEAPTIRRAGWLVNKAESAARHVPGYTLITVIVGRKLISGDRVAMTGKNLLGGLFGLVPGGTAIFDQLEQAGVVDKAFDWVKKQLTDLNLTWTRTQGTLEQLYDGLVSFSPIANAKRILGGLISDILTFVKRITLKVLEFVIQGALKLAGPYADKVWGILNQAGDVLGTIVKDPLGFALNLVKSVVGGFVKFGANILKHLKAGILGWLFGALTSAGLELPAKLDFKGLMSIVMQVLGLTYANFRARLVKQLGPSGEKKVAMIEKSVEIVKVLMKEGFAGIWKKMLEMIENFKQTLIGGMSDMVITTVIKAGLSWLAGLSNPVGAVVKVVLAIYDLIVAFLERLDQIMDVAKSIFSSIGAIAKGQIQKAIDFVEATIGKSVPVVISFLAAALGLGGITSKIKGVIKKLQAPVTKAMDKLIKFIIKKAKKLFAKLLKKLNGKRKLPAGAFKIGKQSHTLYAKMKGKRKIQMMVATKENTLDGTTEQSARVATEVGQTSKDNKSSEEEVVDGLKTTQKKTKGPAANVDMGSEKKSQLEHLKGLQAEIDKLTKTLNDAGIQVATDPDVTEGGPQDEALIRSVAKRDPTFEGQTMLYKDLQKDAGQDIVPGVKRSTVYDLDHTIEKQYAKAVLKNLHMFDQDNPDANAVQSAGKDKTVVRDASGKNNMGELGKDPASRKKLTGETEKRKYAREDIDLSKIDEGGANLPAIAIYNRTHIQKQGDDPTQMVKTALGEATKEARQAKLNTLLAAQMNHEGREMMKQANADKTSSAELRGNVRKGVERARGFNSRLFGFSADATSRTRGASKKPTEAAAIDKMKSPEMDYVKTEGKGGKYAGAADSKKNVFDSDHIVDKVLPLTAQKQKMMTPDMRKNIKEQVAPGAELDARQAARLEELDSDIYGPDRAMSEYTEYLGYTVLISTAIHREITPGTRKDAGKVTGEFDGHRKAQLGAMVKYVRDGTGDVETIRKALQDAPKGYFKTQSADHEGAVADAYVREVPRVVALNPDAQNDAKKAMTTILSRVQKSLNNSNTLTESLFGAKGAYSAE
ncbi:MAG: hypothetical protein AAGH17_03445, partial [Pseudomonadota bacterium]